MPALPKHGAPSMQVSGINAGFDIFFTPSVVLDSSVRLMHSSYSSGRKDLGGNAGTMLVIVLAIRTGNYKVLIDMTGTHSKPKTLRSITRIITFP